ncbi:MAG: SusC/RagA family TonB-linked outer membrane protein [Bacteroidales bacterium]|nr:SusC/RagA family TonB-linked outer membrane protein [Bacteroidales bacterium]
MKKLKRPFEFRWKTGIFMLLLVFQSQLLLAQKITFVFNDVPLVTVIKEIQRQTPYAFVYNNSLINVNQKVSLVAKEDSITTVMNRLVEGRDLNYMIIGKQITLSPKEFKNEKKTQDNGDRIPKKSISGTVLDENNKPLAWISIQNLTAKQGAFSNEKGEYTIPAKEGDKLLFTSVGMESKEITYSGKSARLDVNMKVDDIALQDIVVTGYQTVSKKHATGSFGVVTAREIEKNPSINIMERLAGKVAGVNFDIRNNNISIRGQNTYGADSRPLIVVDGFPLMEESDGTQKLVKTPGTTDAASFSFLSRINPNDIQSITFLKDAASASIWGSRAANGVIVIETKKGAVHGPQISFTSSFGISSPSDMSKLRTMNSAEYVELEKELFEKGFINDPAKWTTGYYTFNTNKNTSEALEWMFKVQRGTATEAERDAALAEISTRNNRNQIRDYLMQKSMNQQYNLSISGGGENSTYYISASTTKDRPVFRSNDARSVSFTANMSSILFKNRLTLNTGISYNNTYSKSNISTSTALSTSEMGLRPYDMLVDEDNNKINQYIKFRPEVIDDLTSKGYLPWTYNAIDELNYSNVTSGEDLVRINASARLRIFNWLTYDVSGSYQTNIGEIITYNEKDSYTTRQLINEATSISSAGKLVYGIPLGGVYKTTNRKAKDYSLRSQFNINKNWDKNNSLNIILGSELRESNSFGYSKTLYGFDDDTYMSQVVNPTTYYQTIYPWTTYIGYNDGSITAPKKRYMSIYSNAIYTYKQRYSVSASVRYDDNSIQGAKAQERAKPFWSAGLSWNVKEEDFLKSLDIISNMNVRLTYGTGGTIPSTSGSYNTTVITIPGIMNGTNKTYASILSPANDRLSWETTGQFNAGLDLGLLDNRIIITFDAYSKKTNGILYNMPFNSTYGYSNIRYNAASLSNHGYDLGIITRITKDNFEWSSNLTFAYNTNKVTDSRFPKNSSAPQLVGSSNPITSLPLDYLYVYRWGGLDDKGQSQILTKNGDILKSTDNATKLTADDLKYAGRRIAPYSGGWTNEFSYKNLSLNIQMIYNIGHKFIKSSVENYPTYTGYTGVIGTNEDLAKRWKNPGDESVTNIPGLSNINYNSISRYRFSDLLVRDASHIRLQQISLLYNIPYIFLKKTLIKSVSVGLSVRNVGILWRKNKDGIDPLYVQLNNYSNLPPSKNFIFSINATF